MPFGPWAGFDDCLDDMEKRYDTETAKNVCGALKRDLGGSAQRVLKQATPEQIKELTDNKKVSSFEDNGRLYLNIFLLDGSVNENDWGVTPESIPRNIYSAIGKPLVLYKNTGLEPDAHLRTPGEFDHPPVAAYNKEGDITHALAYQDLFRIGTYIDVYESKTKPGQWYGIAEITDTDARKAIQEDPKIPLFVSPTVRLFHPFQADQSLRDWEFMHSALVDRPAYGIKKAFINGQCSGNEQTCMLQLKRASIQKNGGTYSSCGFCRYKAIKQIQGNVRSAKSFSSQARSKQHIPSDIMTNDASQTNTSHGVVSELDPATNQQRTVAQESSTTSQNPNAPQLREEVSKTVRRKYSSEEENEKDEDEEEKDQQQNPNQDNPTTQVPTNNKKNRKASLDELSAKIEDLAAQKKTLEIELENERNAKTAMKTLLEKTNSTIEKYSDKVAALEKKDQEREHQAKLSQIQNLVYNSAVYKELSREAKEKQIETWANSGLTVEKIQEIVEPMNASIKKASMSRGGIYASKVSLGGPSRTMVNGATDFTGQRPTPEVDPNSATVKQASVPARKSTAGDIDEDLGAFSLVTQMFPGRA